MNAFQLSNQEIADIFDGEDEDFMDAEAEEDDFKDLVEEHEDEVKQNRKLLKKNTIDDDDDDDGHDDDNDNVDLGLWINLVKKRYFVFVVRS